MKITNHEKDVLCVKYNRILLTGFMGSGKSTIGRALSVRLGYPFVDTDALIEQNEGKSVAELFKERGEMEFRTLEHRITYDLTRKTALVVSSGGGYILTNSVYQLAAGNFTIVYVDAPFELCLGRIKQDSTRPLAQGRTPEELHALYESRNGIYQVRCDFKVDASKMLLSDIITDIISGIQ
ncbi:MAG: shikimate kinase [Acetanaerobacterium sp.]